MKEIELTQGKHALVDDADYEQLSKFKWYANSHRHYFYAIRRVGSKKIKMHRLITNAPDGMDVDHVDGNGLNNTRENLRIATRAENRRNGRKNIDNTSGYKGVSYHKIHGNYQAMIGVDGKVIHLGTFTSPAVAARVYDKAALKYHGEFARLNFQENI